MKQTSPNLPIHALIVSAGRGSRFGADVPKQYLMVAGRTVLEHGVACLNVPAVTDLTLVVAKDDTLVSSLDFEFDRPVYLTEGGAERFLRSRQAWMTLLGERLVMCGCLSMMVPDRACLLMI